MTKKSEQPLIPTQQTTDHNTPTQPALPGLQFPALQLQLQSAMHIGPLPPPQTLLGYGQIDHSFPNRLVTMAEENARTERKTAERAQTFSLAERLTARLFGLMFALGGIGLAAFLAMNGHDTVAGVIGGTTVVAVTIALIAGKAP